MINDTVMRAEDGGVPIPCDKCKRVDCICPPPPIDPPPGGDEVN